MRTIMDMNTDRYTLVASATQPGWWVLTDTQYGIVCRFATHRFAETQKITITDQSKLAGLSVSDVAHIMCEMADWGAAYHYDILMPRTAISDRVRLGQQLARIRQAKDMTQQELSDRTGIHRVTIANMESGLYNLSIDNLSRVAKALDCRIDITPDK